MASAERIRPGMLVPCTDLKFFGVGVRRVAVGQVHIGALFRDRHDEVRLLHLAWQDRLICEKVSANYWWGDCGMHPINCQILAMLCEKVSTKLVGAQVDWGWSYDGGSSSPLSSEGGWSKDRKAMTCATFVLALFATNGFRVVDTETWRTRREDQQWAERMLARMKVASAAHHQALSQAIPGMTRVRPCEVAVAVTGENPPYSYEQILLASQELRERLLADEA